MALTIAAAAAVASAGIGAYSAVQSGEAQSQSNANSKRAFDLNERANTQNQQLDLINSLKNWRQLQLDNSRYDTARQDELAQRALINKLATASQFDNNGNSLEYDPVTGSWHTINRGLGATNAERARVLSALTNSAALAGNVTGNRQAHDRQVEGGIAQTKERALGQALLARYSGNQGRTPEQMEGAGIEKNVARAMDPIQTGGNMAILAGYRQGNSGNDALMGALARQGAGATRSAIADARFDAPMLALNERDAATKALLGPATTLMQHGTAQPGDNVPQFTGDTSSNLMAAIQRNNPAGVGSQLNPRNGQQLAIGQRAGTQTGFTPLNAQGNMYAGISESVQSLLNNKKLMNYFGGSGGMDMPSDTGMPKGLYDPAVQGSGTW